MFRVLLALAIYLGLDFLAAWWMMACLAWSHQCDARVPALGFWATFWLMSFLGTPAALVVGASEARKS